MSIFISPYDRLNNNYLNVSSLFDLFEIYYKTEEGPLGFNIDEKSSNIFRRLVEGSIWYSEYNGRFTAIDRVFLEKNRMLGFDGVFMLPTEYITKEIAKEEKMQLVNKKNQLLKKYNKPLIAEYPSFFSDFYSKDERKYTSHKIESLLDRGIEIAIGDRDSLGSHFIMKQGSVFMNRLILCCNDLNVPIKMVDSDRYIPAW